VTVNRKVDVDRARSVLGQPALTWLVDRCRQRLSRGQPLTGAVIRADASVAERDIADRVLGRRPTSGTSLRLDLEVLARILREAGIADRLEDAITAITGPVVDQAAKQAEMEAHWAAFWSRVGERVAGDAAREQFVDEIQRSGLLRRLTVSDATVAESLFNRALDVLDRLPPDAVPLARFAAATTGDGHGLDPDRPLATLVLRGVEHLTGFVRADRTARERRTLWARVGVLCDELSAPALVLGLRAAGTSVTDRLLAVAYDAGEPARVTLRQLIRHRPKLVDREVWLCENPAVVAAVADRLGPAALPLVCTDGQPSGAVQTLLEQLAAAGAHLRFHVDIDWGGMLIGNLLVGRLGAEPWRLNVDDYLAGPDGVPLRGQPVVAHWEPRLHEAMRARGTAVHEEGVLDVLLNDLGRA
jgi:uncharacterized protein (TIGR02679 family)